MAQEKPFHLQGNFAPVSGELTVSDLEVEGAIPPELTGLYVRNGANPPSGHSDHWFLGAGMVHGVRLDAGRASWYRNRYVKTPQLENPDLQRISELGVVDRTASNANTHVVGHGGQILALEEGSFPYVLDKELELLDRVFVGDHVVAELPHPDEPELLPAVLDLLERLIDELGVDDTGTHEASL